MEDDEINECSHARLTAAISKLDRTQHIRTPVRGELSKLTGEFDLVKTNRLDVGGIVNVLENSAKYVEIGKTIKKTHVREKILPKPLEKPQAERIKRSSTFESTRKKLGRWDAAVARSRTVDFVSFPLKTAVNKLTQTKDYLSKLKLKCDLECELDKVEGRTEEMLEDEEEKFPLSYEEMLEQRREMAKLRAQQSFKAAKAKRQSKIKSKKYHRTLKKERMKQQLQEFEELRKSDPEEALRRLESLEKSRAEERHTLRHKNTGKWAKSKLVRAKYNPEVRQQLAEQLSVSRNLTQKVQALQSSEDESEKEEAILDLLVTQDPMNPWMTNSKKSAEEDNFDFGYKKYVKEKISKDFSSDDDENDAETSINDDKNYEIQPNNVKGAHVQNGHGSESDDSIEYKSNNTKIDNDSNTESGNNVNLGKSADKTELISIEQKITVSNKYKKAISTTEWAVEIVEGAIPVEKPMKKNKKQVDVTQAFDTLDSELNKKVQEKIRKLREDIEKINTNPDPYKKRTWQGDNKEDNLSKLGFKNKKIKPIIDTELNETTDKDPLTSTASTETNKLLKDIVNSAGSVAAGNSESTTSDVDPTRFIAAKPKYLATALSDGNDGLDNIDDEEQVVPKVNIEDVFEEDDVVASFRQEKEDEINKDKITDVDLRLPGWGNWGGKGVKVPKRKSSRFIFKVLPKLPRRDENKGDIIIKEFKDPKLAVHKVTELPFPFTSLKDFEASIRAPLGNTFIPEIAHRKVIKPSVFTKAGTIIEPMDDDELMVPRNQSFKNKNIIKLLGNK